ncbi:hypothetical protein [Reichenbachiella versicolor]|uniref:hypothetical protein n=1 Tax=Reichenbachiella versicolor TaxID=1821036 RepID=UPI000D6DFC8C|nr:hypothetical protein [Reichenbachiella versicolor]
MLFKLNQRGVILFATLLLLSFQKLHAQEATIEKSITGINVGLSGLSLSQEKRFTPTFSLRLEAGTGYARMQGSNVWYPYFAIQPRWYYNLEKRVSKTKNIRSNSGNFISTVVFYEPESVQKINNGTIRSGFIFLGPVWGMRRQVGKRFSFEFSLGAGWYRRFNEDPENVFGQYIDLNFGYNFIKR